MEWTKVEDALPEKGLSLYFVSEGEVHNGFYDEDSVVDESIKLEGLFNSAYKTIECFQGYNYGYDGDDAPVYNVTHWMYEDIPELPKELK